MINLTEEFNEMIGDDHDVILIRHNTTTHCKCWRHQTATPDPQCPNCLGSGFVFIEFIKTGKTFKLDEDIMRFYCPIDTDSYNVRKGDLLFEIWVNDKGTFLSNPKLGDNILKQNRWEVYNVVAPKSENHIPHFIRFDARKQPSTR